MRCLHCGNEVSLLLKLTDAQFCSAEHRQNFYDDQQRLILERLQASAARFNRYRRSAATPVTAAIPAEAPAPAAIASFRIQQTPELNAREFTLFMLGALDAAALPATLPALLSSPSTGYRRLSAPVFDIPWAKYNAGLLAFDEILPELEFKQIVAGLALSTPIRDWGTLAKGRLVDFGQPHAAGRGRSFPIATIETAWDLFAVGVNLNTAKLRRSIVRPPLVLPGFRKVGIVAPRIFNGNTAPFIGAPPELLVPPTAVSWNALQLDAGSRQRGMAFLDRVFRMRARSGILSKDMPAHTRIESHVEPCPSLDPLSSSARSLSIGIAVGLSKTDRFFRARPRAGVVPDSIESFTRIEPSVIANESTYSPAIPANAWFAATANVRSPSTPASLALTPAPFVGPEYHGIDVFRVAESLVGPSKPKGISYTDSAAFEPIRVERTFRMRPRSGVADPKIAGLVVTAGNEPFPSIPAVPAIPARQEFSPAAARKFASGRPRGPVPAATATFEQVSSGGFTTLVSEPSIRHSLSGASEVAPKFITRMFRAKPRSPLAPTGQVATCEAGMPIDAAVPSPVMVTSAPSTSAVCEPRQVQRLSRFRARGPVASAVCSEYHRVSRGEIGFVSQCTYPSLAPAGADLSPSVSDRLIRMRPHSGVIAADLADLSSSVAGVETLISPPAIFGMKIAACAPEMVTKPFRMRARSGITSDRTAPFEQIHTATQSLAAHGAWPITKTSVGRDLVVPPIDRIYRMRARAGVGGGAELIRIGVTPQEFPPNPATVYAVIAECAPALVVRLCRARPRGPADVAITLSHIGCTPLGVELEPFQGGYPLGRGVAPSPAFMNRMYRVRPRPPLDDIRTQMANIRFKHLAAPDPEALLPALHPSILDVPEPAQLEKLYRMRPKSGRQAAADSLPIDCAPLTGAGAPDVYSSPAGAFAGTSALDALKSLSKNWKTIPTDLKAVAMVVPLLFCLALIPFGGKESSVAQASTTNTASLHNAVSAEFDRVGREIRSRAAIAVEDNFGAGLDRWKGAEGWRDTWSIQPSGWISPGKLALLTPSVELKDYRLEFSGQILSRSLGFVVRAADISNYYAVKFKLSTRGVNVPTMTVVRMKVVDGKERDRKESTVPMPVTKDAVYQVSVDVNDQYFTLMIRDKVVDFWSDAQLKSGGIGFFTDKGEQALIHDVKVRHQYDALGRLVAATLPAER
jgi:hypothetical protein